MEDMLVVKQKAMILGRVIHHSFIGWLFLSNVSGQPNGEIYKHSAWGAIPRWARRQNVEFLTVTQFSERGRSKEYSA